MNFSQMVSLSSLFVAAIALIYTYISNTKKYELSSSIRKEILTWYSNVIERLITLKRETETSNNSSVMNEQLAKLSALIEVGRFYFPNIDKNDGFGIEKPTAYKGYRNLLLDFLVYSHQIFERKDAIEYIKHAEFLQRHFTSHLFEILNPQGFLNETKRHTNKKFSKDFIYEDFLQQSPEGYKLKVL